MNRKGPLSRLPLRTLELRQHIRNGVGRLQSQLTPELMDPSGTCLTVALTKMPVQQLPHSSPRGVVDADWGSIFRRHSPVPRPALDREHERSDSILRRESLAVDARGPAAAYCEHFVSFM